MLVPKAFESPQAFEAVVFLSQYLIGPDLHEGALPEELDGLKVDLLCREKPLQPGLLTKAHDDSREVCRVRLETETLELRH